MPHENAHPATSEVHVTIDSEASLRHGFRRNPETTGLLIALLLGLALRAYNLGAFAYSPHEIFALMRARHGAVEPDLVPGFTFLLRVWMGLGLDHGPWLMRTLPLLWSLGAIVVAYFIGKIMMNGRCGVAAAFLTAVSPPLILYGQTLTPPTFVIVVALLSCLFAYLAVQNNDVEWWALYVVTAAIALYFGPSAWLVLCLLHVTWRNRNNLVHFLVGDAIALILFIPFQWRIFTRIHPKLPAHPLADFCQRLLSLGEHATAGFISSPLVSETVLTVVAALAAIGILIVILRHRRAALLLSSLAIILPVLVLIFLPQNAPIVPFLAPSLTVLLILAAVPLSSIPNGRLSGIATSLVLVLLLFVFSQQKAALAPAQVEPRFAYDRAAGYIESQWREGDVIVHPDPSSLVPMLIHQNPDHPVGAVALGKSAEIAYAARLDAMPAGILPAQIRPHDIAAVAKAYTRVWLVMSAVDRRDLAGNPIRVKTWLDHHFFQTNHASFPGVELFCYEQKVDKRWTRVVRRDHDDGCGADITYSYGQKRIYHAVKADLGIVQTGEAQRRGALRVHFESPAKDAQTLDMNAEGAVNEQGFVVENTSDTPVQIHLAALSSGALLETASMDRTRDGLNVWRLRQGPIAAGQKPSYDRPIMEAFVNNLTPHGQLKGGIALNEGVYDTYIRQQFANAQSPKDRALVTFSVSERPVYSGFAQRPDYEAGWHWSPAGQHHQPAYDGLLHIELEASLPNGLDAAHAGVNAIAFVPADSAGKPEASWKQSYREVSVEVPAHGSRHWVCRHGARSKRLDVWVESEGSEHRDYRIFAEQN